MNSLINKKVDMFCGTGGVGKTTLATARALSLASQGKKILIITIDPSKRLKQILKIDDSAAGVVEKISSKNIIKKDHFEFHFDALLMAPEATLKRMAKEHHAEKEFQNPILKILSKPYGGMNEIMSIIEVQYYLDKKEYDTIILDTPPGKHFLDFLQSTQKINHFFDSSILQIFTFLGKDKNLKKKKSNHLMKRFVSAGIKKLLQYLEKVTGKDFIEQFIDAISTIYHVKDSFLQALNFQEKLKDPTFCNCFFVTSTEQDKVSELIDLQKDIETIIKGDKYLLINKSSHDFLEKWNTDKLDPLFSLKESMLRKENKLKRLETGSFNDTFYFSDVLEPKPEQHVISLMKKWGEL